MKYINISFTSQDNNVSFNFYDFFDVVKNSESDKKAFCFIISSIFGLSIDICKKIVNDEIKSIDVTRINLYNEIIDFSIDDRICSNKIEEKIDEMIKNWFNYGSLGILFKYIKFNVMIKEI